MINADINRYRPLTCLLPFLLSLLTVSCSGEAREGVSDPIEWSSAGLSGGDLLAGSHSGRVGDHLFFAGGSDAQYPPALGAESRVTSRISRLEADRQGAFVLRETSVTLPHPVAYGAAVATPSGLLIAGGSDGETDFDTVYLISADGGGEPVLEELPRLPEPLVFASAAYRQGTVIVAGGLGAERNPDRPGRAYALQLEREGAVREWSRLPDLPGRTTLAASAGIQDDGLGDALYLFGSFPRHHDAALDNGAAAPVYRFRRGEWGEAAAPAGDARAEGGAAFPYGEAHLLLFGEKVHAYHTITDSWADAGALPGGLLAAGAPFAYEDGIGLPARTPDGERQMLLRGAFETVSLPFGAVNYTVIALYMALLVGMGYYFSRQREGVDYFLAGQRIPWWAAGLSIYATQLSAITFIALPALAFATNWLVFPSYFTILMMVPIVIAFYLPFFRRLRITTAYEYLELRFSPAVRLFGSLSFMLFQLGRMSVLVFLPALVITAIIGMDIYLAIILMGILSIVYTVLGGMEAVVWTDVLQVFVLMFGILYSLLFVVVDAGGFGSVYTMALSDGKLTLLDWSGSVTELVTWSIFLGSFALQFGPYTTDQAVIQRYLTTSSEKEAAKSLWTNGLMAVPTGFLFFALGSCLYVFYKLNPELIALGMQNDQIFPLFIGQQLPAGLAGLVIAGIFAATMSSMDSSMHSIATAWSVDVHPRLFGRREGEAMRRVARIVVLVVGLFGILTACMLALLPIRSLYFLFQEIVGLLGSALAGIFILGIFTRKANAAGVLSGAVASLILMAAAKFLTGIHFYLYPLIGIPACLGIGYLVSRLWPKSQGRTEGLTYRTLRAPHSGEAEPQQNQNLSQ